MQAFRRSGAVRINIGPLRLMLPTISASEGLFRWYWLKTLRAPTVSRVTMGWRISYGSRNYLRQATYTAASSAYLHSSSPARLVSGMFVRKILYIRVRLTRNEDRELCVPAKQLQAAVSLSTSGERVIDYPAIAPGEHRQPGSLAHTYHRFSVRDRDCTSILVPSDDIHLSYNLVISVRRTLLARMMYLGSEMVNLDSATLLVIQQRLLYSVLFERR